LGKKWTKEWSLPEGLSFGSTLTTQQEQTLNQNPPKKIKGGWIEYDRNNNEYIFPPIDDQLLNNLPDGVGPDVPDQDWVGDTRRVLIGDGTGFVGPLTWNEACKLVHVAKIIQPSEEYLPTASASGSISTEGGGSASASSTTGSGTYTQQGEFPSESNPLNLFKTPSSLAKFKSENITNTDGSSSGFSGGNRASATAAFTGKASINIPSIAIDIDKPEDFYVNFSASSDVLARGSASVSFYQLKSKFVSEFVSLEQTYYVFTSGYRDLFGGTDSSIRTLVFNSSQEYTFTIRNTFPVDVTSETTQKEIEKNGSLKIGSKTLQLKMYGIRQESNAQPNEASGYVTASADANISHPPPEFTVAEWWPYKNADGQPVWNTSTGTLVNSPLP
jgi:hypothetical protein